jgi:dTDP-4-dehydrorhamnose 3,5-epimerase|tara:strand:- start:137 stop:643 length:507 start_codon:yes stop_codon:yes gene_type:complete
MKLEKPLHYKRILNIFEDERGFLNATSFNELLSKIELSKIEIKYQLISKTKCMHTFRGFHYQDEPCLQKKIIFLHSGKIKDYIFPFNEPRKENVESFILEAGDVLIVPETYAHGFITLSDNVIIQYLMNNDYNEDLYKGINGYKFVKNDLNIKDIIISEKDKSYQTKI